MALSNDRNADNKRYDSLSQFTLKIVVSKGDKRAQILSRMASGTIIGYKTLHEAMEAQSKFHELATATEPLGDFASYGLTCIIDERDGCIHSVLHLA